MLVVRNCFVAKQKRKQTRCAIERGSRHCQDSKSSGSD